MAPGFHNPAALEHMDPIGVQFSAGYPTPDPRNEVTIVGVIGDVRQKTLADPAEPAFYVPLTQVPLRLGRRSCARPDRPALLREW